MHRYLLAETNREAILTHNQDMIRERTDKIGQATYTSWDFNSEEEFRQLNRNLTIPDAADLTVEAIATSLYGSEDDILVRRVRGFLKFGSGYQKTLVNGRAVLARTDGTLRITGNAEEYGAVVQEATAEAVATAERSLTSATGRMNRTLTIAQEKVPELAETLEQVRETAADHLANVFTQRLELLRGHG